MNITTKMDAAISHMNIKENMLTKLNSILLVILMLICAFEYIVFNFHIPAAIWTYAIYAVVIGIIMLMIFCHLMYGINSDTLKLYALLMLTIVYVMVLSLLKPYSPDSGITKYIAFLPVLLLSKARLKRSHLIILISSFLFVLLVFYRQSSEYIDLVYFSGMIDTFYNPNAVALAVILVFMYLNAFIKDISFSFKKILLLVLFILTVMAVWRLNSRAMLIGVVVFVIFDWIIPKSFWKKRQYVAIIFAVLIALNYLITLTYVWLYESNIVTNFAFMTTVGKGFFSGREVIWGQFYNEIFSNPIHLLFGLGWNQNLTGGSFHNQQFDIISANGLIGLVLYILFIWKIISKIYEKRVSNVQISYLLIFFSFLVAGVLDYMAGFTQTILIHLSLGVALSPCYLNSEIKSLRPDIRRVYRRIIGR